MRTAVTAALLIVWAGLGRQAQRQAEGAGDSARAPYRDRVIALRDTVQAVSRAIVVLRRDLRTAGPETVLSKAESLLRACRSVRGALLDGLPALAPREVPAAARPAADSLRIAMRDLTRRLEVHCEAGLDPKGPGIAADTIRAWGPYRTSELRRGIDRFQLGVARFAAAAHFKLPIAGH